MRLSTLPWLLAGALVSAASAKAQGKGVRDPLGLAAHHLESENFRIVWGDAMGIPMENIERLSEALEESWRIEIGAMGYPQPVGTDVYKMNVYIGSTGPGTPDALPSFAYAAADDEGIPMLVYSVERMQNVPKMVSSAAHEFFHTVQMSVGAYPDDVGYWWWEATATWIAEEVFPDQFWAGYLPSVASYVFYPHLSLSFFEIPAADWKVFQGHHYGAFLLCRYLTDEVSDADLIKASWLETHREPDPLVVLERLLADKGHDLKTLFSEFAARTAVLDYGDSAEYRRAVTQMLALYPEDDHRFSARLPADGTDWRPADPKLLPGHDAYNIIRIEDPAPGPWIIQFEAGSGDRGSEPIFGVTIINIDDQQITFVDLSLEQGRGQLDLAVSGEELLVVVSVWADIRRLGERFNYRYAIRPVVDTAMDAGTPAPSHDASILTSDVKTQVDAGEPMDANISKGPTDSGMPLAGAEDGGCRSTGNSGLVLGLLGLITLAAFKKRSSKGRSS